MPLFIFILGFLSTIPFSFSSTLLTKKVVPKHSFLIAIQQDSTPPPTQKGVVKIKNLEKPTKNKRTPKAKKTTNKQLLPTSPSPTPPPITEKETSSSSTTSHQEDPFGIPSPSRIPKRKGLSTEEEIKLLSRTKSIVAENKIHPESAKNCRFAFDVIDEFTGVQKRGLDNRFFFAYTPDEYRKFIKSNDFIHCEGFLSQSSAGSMALNINLSVASRAAKQKFGAIKANSAMVIRTMEGKEYYLMTYPGAAPQVIDNKTHYQCSFAINKSDLKHLKKAEIDQVKISFQKGFQTYDVFYLDFLIDQFPCFEE